MAQYVGRPLTEERPRLDARLPDGSRIHVVLAPVARRGTTISIRKFFAEKLTVEKLIQLGSMTRRVARLLEAAVGLRLNIVVSGGTGSGKTSLLNVLSQFIAEDERILIIEDSAELQLTQPHIVGFEARPADRLGKGQVDIGDLLHSALRLRPDRIVVGEVRGGECFYLLQAMNTGHGGTLTTAHANTPVDTLRRLESLCLLSGVELPLIAVRAQVASAVHLVVSCERFPDGSRKITHVTEVLPLDERGEYRVQDLVRFEQTGRERDGRVRGVFKSTGVKPTFFSRFAASGYSDVDESFFAGGSEEAPLPEPVAALDTVPEQKPVARPSTPARKSGSSGCGPAARARSWRCRLRRVPERCWPAPARRRSSRRWCGSTRANAATRTPSTARAIRRDFAITRCTRSTRPRSSCCRFRRSPISAAPAAIAASRNCRASARACCSISPHRARSAVPRSISAATRAS